MDRHSRDLRCVSGGYYDRRNRRGHQRYARAVTADGFLYFLPAFFASMGLRTNFITHFDLPLVVVLLIVALIAKFIGGCIGAYLGGKQGNHAFMIGLV